MNCFFFLFRINLLGLALTFKSLREKAFHFLQPLSQLSQVNLTNIIIYRCELLEDEEEAKKEVNR